MREWVVGGGVLIEGDRLLLVRNRRRNGSHDWSPPGGVIDEGETLLEGLTREVQEETGLQVTGWDGPLYEVECEAPDMGWRLRVEAHLATGFEGALRAQDPDGIVVDARFVATQDCRRLLAGCPPWVREPLVEWLAQRWRREQRPAFGFRVGGRGLGSLVVARRWP